MNQVCQMKYNNANKRNIMRRYNFMVTISCGLCLLAVMALTGCSGMLDTDSEQVEFLDGHQLNSPTDSVYSVMGIIHKLQVLADRTVLLGEARSDLVSPTDHANADLKALASFNATADNQYNSISDYYDARAARRRQNLRVGVCRSQGFPCLGLPAVEHGLWQRAPHHGARAHGE